MTAGSAVHLHVEDVDQMTARATKAVAEVVMESQGQFDDERTARLPDPFRHEWLAGHSIEDVPIREMPRYLIAIFQF